METWELFGVSLADERVLRIWGQGFAKVERIDSETVNVSVDDAEGEEALVTYAESNGFACRLL